MAAISLKPLHNHRCSNVVHVFLLLVFVGFGDARKLVSDDMHFLKIETCNYYARELVRRFGPQVQQKDWGVAYCVPAFVDREKVEIY